MKSGVVDIVIVNLNGKHYLQKCLSSVIARSGHIPCRFVVVDNGSTDGSVVWVRHKYPDALVIENERNVGFSRACNQGILQSDGEFVLLLNNDTKFLNDVLGTLVEFVRDRDKTGLVGPLTLFPSGDIQPSIKHFPSVWQFVLQETGLPRFLVSNSRIYYPYGPFRLSDYEDVTEVEWLSGSCLLFRRSLFEELGPLDEKMPFGVEDMDYALRALEAGYKNYFVPQAQLLHHKGGSRQNDQAREQLDFVRRAYEQGIRVYFKKHHSPVAYWLIEVSLTVGKVPRMLLRKGLYGYAQRS